jgi:2-polyprenyl-3-methyl-5-hydroxy-6-metoxy-1,4-benzoquinol methylase
MELVETCMIHRWNPQLMEDIKEIIYSEILNNCEAKLRNKMSMMISKIHRTFLWWGASPIGQNEVLCVWDSNTS